MIYSRSPPGGTDSPLTFIILREINTLETAFSLSPHLSLGLWPMRKKCILTSKRRQNPWAFTLVPGPPATPESWVTAGSSITSCSAQSSATYLFWGPVSELASLHLISLFAGYPPSPQEPYFFVRFPVETQIRKRFKFFL